MKTISYKLKDLDQKEKKVTLKLGYVGENEHVQIRIDCSEIWENYPNAVASLAVEPPEGSKYPAIVTREGNVVCWTVKDSDVVHDGDGRIQLTFTEGSEIQKTVICRTKVDESIIGSGTTPDPIADFVSEANEALAELEAAEVHEPVIGEDGYWYTWSKDAGEYVKTDTKAQGEDGQQGPAGKDGADGAPGQDGHTPVKGTDYWTQQDQADIVAAAALETVSAVIDDTAGDGDTNKTWSANKLNDQFGGVLNDIHGLSDETNHEYKYADLLYYKNLLNNKKWEEGTINSSTGIDTADSASIRTIGSVSISDSVLILQLAGARNYTLYIYEYGANGYIGRKYWSYTLYGSDIKDIHLDSGVTSLRFVAYSSGGDYAKNLASISASVCYELREFFNYSTEYVKLNPYHGKSITTVNEEQRTGNVPQSNKQYLYKAGSFTITTDGSGYVGAEMYFLCPAIGSTLNVNATRSAGNQWVTRVLFFDSTFTQIGSQSTSNTSTHQVTVPSGTRFVKITFGCCWGTALADNTQVTFSNVEVYYAVADGFSDIGTLSGLHTTAKSNLVSAINEVADKQAAVHKFDNIWMFDAGHQGYFEEAPASSVASFVRAKVKGYNTLECDIRLTSDNEFVICHNDYLPSDTSYKISQHTYAELYQNQNLGTYNSITQKIMKFVELIQLAKELDMKVFVELKSTLTQQQIADLMEIVKLQGMNERVYWMADVKDTSAQYAGIFRTVDPMCNLLINFNRSYSDFANFVIQGHPEKTYCYAWGGYIDDTIINTFATNGLQMVAWCVSYDYYYPELTTDALIKQEIMRVIGCGAVGMCLDKWSLSEIYSEKYADYFD